MPRAAFLRWSINSNCPLSSLLIRFHKTVAMSSPFHLPLLQRARSRHCLWTTQPVAGVLRSEARPSGDTDTADTVSRVSACRRRARLFAEPRTMQATRGNGPIRAVGRLCRGAPDPVAGLWCAGAGKNGCPVRSGAFADPCDGCAGQTTQVYGVANVCSRSLILCIK